MKNKPKKRFKLIRIASIIVVVSIIGLSIFSIFFWPHHSQKTNSNTQYTPKIREAPDIVFSVDYNNSQIIIEDITYHNTSIYYWDSVNIIASNSTKISPLTRLNNVKGSRSIQVGQTIDLYNWSDINELVEVKIIWIPTNESLGDFTLNITGEEPKIKNISPNYLSFQNYDYDSDENITEQSRIFSIGDNIKDFQCWNTISWNITAEIPNWINISPIKGILDCYSPYPYEDRDVKVTVNYTGVTPGTYRYTIYINSINAIEMVNLSIDVL